MDKLGVLLSRGGGTGGEAAARDDVPWWLRYSGRGLGTVGSFLAIVLGLYNCLGILLADVSCLLGGLWQMVAGFLVIVCEAPCCCFFVDFVQAFSDKIENRPLWNKAVGYIGLSIPPFIMCFGLATLFGSGLIFATGILYGMMALGKKASADEMRSAASLEAGAGAGAGGAGPPPYSAARSTLVDNAQPISFTGSPVKSEPY